MLRHDTSPVTLRAIAEKVGVAPCTVSVVLRGQSRERRVGRETELRIRQAARSMGYSPNPLARGLRGCRTGVVALVLADFTNNWSDRVLRGIEPVLQDADAVPFIAIHRWRPEAEARIVDRCLQRRVDGILTVPLPGNAPLYEDLRRRGVPLAFLSDTLDETPWAPYVAWDSAAAARRAVGHLLSIGRRRIAILHQDWSARLGGRIRLAAVHAELAAAGAASPPEWTVQVSGDAEVAPALGRVFSAPDRPDALYANNDGLAFSALAALRGLGLRVPEDVAVIGMGDLPRGIDAGLTSVREPCEDIGRLAAETLLRLLDPATRLEEGGAPSHQILVPGDDLVVRASTTLPNIHAQGTQP